MAQKTKIITVRVTEAEHHALTQAYGKPTTALRHLINQWKHHITNQKDTDKAVSYIRSPDSTKYIAEYHED